MYEYLSGTLIEKSATRIVIEVQGIGYELRIPVSTFSRLPVLGEKVRILTHFHVREDIQQLFGFYSQEERDLFRLLISVSGIGPKTAMTALSGMTPAELKQAIIKGAVPALTSISGIGKKTAERIIVELREKIVVEELPAGSQGLNVQTETVIEDSIRALMELGYKRQSAKTAIERALKELDASSSSVSEVIRKSLKYV